MLIVITTRLYYFCIVHSLYVYFIFILQSFYDSFIPEIPREQREKAKTELSLFFCLLAAGSSVDGNVCNRERIGKEKEV